MFNGKHLKVCCIPLTNLVSFILNLTESTLLPSFLITGCLLLLVSGVLLTVFCIYQKNKNLNSRKRNLDNPKPKFTSEANELHQLTQNDDSSLLTKWISENPKMFHPQRCIEKCEELGHGQFGTVFKGNFTCILTGKAM